MAVEVFVANEQEDEPVELERWSELAGQVLQAQRVSERSELSVLFVDEATISELNLRFLGREGPTDVLAFPMEDEPLQAGRFPDSGGSAPGWEPPESPGSTELLGDVVICPKVARRNAAEHGNGYEDELALLLVHGILHLLGMDHDDETEAEAMEAREQELLAAFYTAAEPGNSSWHLRP